MSLLNEESALDDSLRIARLALHQEQDDKRALREEIDRLRRELTQARADVESWQYTATENAEFFEQALAEAEQARAWARAWKQAATGWRGSADLECHRAITGIWSRNRREARRKLAQAQKTP